MLTRFDKLVAVNILLLWVNLVAAPDMEWTRTAVAIFLLLLCCYKDNQNSLVSVSNVDMQCI